MKLKPRVGRQRPLLAAGSPGVKPCNMLLFPAPSRPRTRTCRFPRSSSSCRWRAKTVRVRKGLKNWRQKLKHTWFIQQRRRRFAQFYDENGANILMINSVNVLRRIMNIKPRPNLTKQRLSELHRWRLKSLSGLHIEGLSDSKLNICAFWMKRDI